MTRSFTVVVERDPESNWLVGEVVDYLAVTPKPLTCPGWRGICGRRYRFIYKIAPRAVEVMPSGS